MKYSGGLTVLLLSFLAACVCEAISWALIYRTPAYRNLQTTIEKASKKLEVIKAAGAAAKTKSKTRKADRMEGSLKASKTELTSISMKSTLVVMGTLTIVWTLLNSAYDGIVVARLPFEAPWGIKGLSHRGLASDDYTECNMAFLYTVASMVFRANLQKLLGFAPPRPSAPPNPFAGVAGGK